MYVLRKIEPKDGGYDYKPEVTNRMKIHIMRNEAHDIIRKEKAYADYKTEEEFFHTFNTLIVSEKVTTGALSSAPPQGCACGGRLFNVGLPSYCDEPTTSPVADHQGRLTMHEDDTPIFRELLEEAAKSRRITGTLLEAVYSDHYDRHEGPIMFCDAAACRAAWSATRWVA